MNKTVDELLVMRSQDGDTAAFELLFKRWQKRLLRHAWHVTQNHDAAVEVAQDTWLAIVLGIGRLDDSARFPQWALRIVTNKGVDWVRRQQRARKITEQLSGNKHSSSDRAENNDEQNDIALLKDGLKKLSPDQRALLSMLYLDGLSIVEIAHALAIPAGTVKSRLYHARLHLKKLVGG